MTLAELEPRWLNENVLAFRCPHCREDWLTLKTVVMRLRDQFALYQAAFGDDWNRKIVPCKEDFAWAVSGELSNLTVIPSVDASASGHWHGYITNGQIVGGVQAEVGP